MQKLDNRTPRVLVIGAGPAGLMAAEVLAAAGVPVDLYDAMPSAGRKFLLAGKGGLNLTHSEAFGAFMQRYGQRQRELEPIIAAFDADAVRAWADGLGVATFVGSSGRVFPRDMKAAPLLRAWLHRLRATGVRLHMRQRWCGWDGDGRLRFTSADGATSVTADAVLLALGGGSWARLGSDGAWLPWLRARGAEVAALQPANCGFERPWSEYFRQRFAGAPVLTVAAAVGAEPMRRGQFIVTDSGIEGSLVYAWSAALREQIVHSGQACLQLDLLPDKSHGRVLAEVAGARGSRSLASHLHGSCGLDKLKIALLHELLPKAVLHDGAQLAAAIKCLPLTLDATRPLDEAISSAGGVCFESLDQNLMLRAAPGVFCAGEMLDWEAPTGGYLLTACLASGRWAAHGMLEWLRRGG